MSFNPIPRVRPRYQVSSMIDIPCGQYLEGKHGDAILSGAYSNFIGIGGRGNTHKSTLTHCLNFTILERYSETNCVIYDTELTADWLRLESLMSRFELDFDTVVDEGRLILTSASEYSGNEWWAKVRSMGLERAKNFKKLAKETPFLDRAGKAIKILPMTIHFCDSFSELQTDATNSLYDKHEIDDSKLTTDALRSAGIKTRLVHQIPSVTTAGGMSVITTAHLGDVFVQDKYAPNKQQLSFLKGDVKFKNVPERFTFLAYLCLYIQKANPLVNRSTKASEYPVEGFNSQAGDTDLQLLEVLVLRSKSGKAGSVYPLLISQTEGLLPHLSQFHYLKERDDKLGLLGPEGVQRSYRLALYPDQLLQRTKVRTLVDKDKRLQRALDFTAEMGLMYEYWNKLPNEYRIKPEDLYKKLKDLGYDWNILLDTRGYWTFDHYTHPVPHLSTLDLLRMYNETYIPHWYPEKDKLKVKLKVIEGEVANLSAASRE